MNIKILGTLGFILVAFGLGCASQSTSRNLSSSEPAAEESAEMSAEKSCTSLKADWSSSNSLSANAKSSANKGITILYKYCETFGIGSNYTNKTIAAAASINAAAVWIKSDFLAIAKSSYMSKLQAKAFSDLVITIASNNDVSNSAAKTAAQLKTQYEAQCTKANEYLGMSDATLVSKATAGIGICKVTENKDPKTKSSCPYKIKIAGVGYPIGEGCSTTVQEIAATLRSALNDGQCFTQ